MFSVDLNISRDCFNSSAVHLTLQTKDIHSCKNLENFVHARKLRGCSESLGLVHCEAGNDSVISSFCEFTCQCQLDGAGNCQVALVLTPEVQAKTVSVSELFLHK